MIEAAQSKLMSLVEAIANVVFGFILAMATQLIVFPAFGLSVSVEQNLMISLIFTGVSLARSFLLRRLFEAMRMRLQPSSATAESVARFLPFRSASPVQRD